MPLPHRTKSWQGKTRQPVDQTRYSRNPRTVLAAMIAVGGGDTLKPPDLPNRLFDHEAKLRKGPVVDHIFWWALLAARFAARRKAMLSQLRQLQIGQIATQSDFLWQPFQQPALFQQLDVSGGAGYTRRHLDNPPGVTVHHKLTFECMLLFLPE